MNTFIAIAISAIIVCLVGCPIVNWVDKTKKEMEAENDRAE